MDVSAVEKNPGIKPQQLSAFASLPKTAYYQGGPFFKGAAINQIIANYNTDKPAIIEGKYQAGHYLLLGPHLEIPLKKTKSGEGKSNRAFENFVSIWLPNDEMGSIQEIPKDSDFRESLFQKIVSNTALSVDSDQTHSYRLQVEKNLRFAISKAKEKKISKRKLVGIYADYGTMHEDVQSAYQKMTEQGYDVRLVFSINKTLSPIGSYSKILFPKLKHKIASQVLTKPFIQQLQTANPSNQWVFQKQIKGNEVLFEKLQGRTATEKNLN